MKSKDKQSLILRFSDNFGPEEGTLEAHRLVEKANGAVWYGKIGVPLSEQRLKAIQEQDEPYIYLIEAKLSILAKALLVDSTRTAPSRELIPTYYEARYKDVKTWLKLSKIEFCGQEELQKYVIASSGAAVISTIKNSMNSFFYIKAGKANETYKGKTKLESEESDDYLLSYELSNYQDLLSEY